MGRKLTGVVLVRWSNVSRGHAISVENSGGNVYFIDPQVGERIDIETVLKRSKIPETVFFRTDNLKLGSDVLKLIKKRE